MILTHAGQPTMSKTSDAPFAFLKEIPEDTDQLSVIDEVRLIGRFIWELAGRSLGRLMVTFAAVFLTSFLPSLLLILGLTVASQTYTRTGLLILITLCLIPIGAVVSFNYVTYRGLRDIVEKLAFGQKIGAGFVAFLEPSDRMRIPLSDFTSRLNGYFKKTRHESQTEERGIKRFIFRVVNGMIFYTAWFVLNRIAKGCVVDGEVDLEKFAIAVGERTDEMLISYFKKLLWDLTRLLLSIAVILLWLLIVVVTQLVKFLA